MVQNTFIASEDRFSSTGPLTGGHSVPATVTSATADYGQLSAYANGRHQVTYFSGTHGHLADADAEWHDMVTVNLAGLTTGKVRAFYRINGQTSWSGTVDGATSTAAGWDSFVQVGSSAESRSGVKGLLNVSDPLPIAPNVFMLEHDFTSGSAFELNGKIRAVASNPLAMNANVTGESTASLEWLGFTVTDAADNPLAFTTTSLSGKDWSVAGAGASAVPEPASALLLLAGGLPLVFRRLRNAPPADNEVEGA